MSLLHEIQKALVEGDDLGSVLLRLRILAARLDSKVLRDWVRYEAESYPSNSDVPPYRIIEVAYRAMFVSPIGSNTGHVPVPQSVIHDVAGEAWLVREMRNSISAIDDLVNGIKNGENAVRFEAGDLIPRLHGCVYEDFACHDIYGIMSRTLLVGIQTAVRSRVLEFVLELERSIPSSAEIDLQTVVKPSDYDTSKVAEIYYQVVFGDAFNMMATGSGSQINISVGEQDGRSMVACLIEAGILESDAEEFAKIVASEPPGSQEEPLGAKAKKWLVDNVKKAADGTWKVGLSTAVKVITEAVLRFHGFG